MSDNHLNARVAGISDANVDQGLRSYMTRVYGLMSSAMFVTFVLAYIVGNSATMMNALFSGFTRYIIMFLPLIMVFAFGATINKLSVGAATLFFYAFAAAMGISISYIFAIYSGFSIATVFLYTAIGFLALSLYGYTTKKDLTGWGSFLMMGVVGLILASLVNLFIGSSVLQFAISFIGVLVFAGLTAYDTQNIKNSYFAYAQAGVSVLGKGALMGALNLYINFINMFMMLLSLLGSRE